jgi:DNA-binding GntR family transcriptional regulator
MVERTAAEISSISGAERKRDARGTRKSVGSHDISSPDRVVESIVQGIRLGRYVPGQKLVEADLTRALRVSRAPVREAFKRLSAEGVVTITRHRGAYIRALTRTEVSESLIVLEVLTGLMAALAAEAVRKRTHPDRVCQGCESLKLYGKPDGIDTIDKRTRFYDLLGSIGGNLQLSRIMPAIQIHLLRMQMQPYMAPADDLWHLRDYAEITAAVLAGNRRQAERAMRKHIRRARRRYARLPDEAFVTPQAAA